MCKDGKRRSIRLGSVNKKTASEVKLKIEHLNALHVSGLPMDTETAAWVAKIGDDLAAVGLIDIRPKTVTLVELLRRYGDEKERDNKAGTKTNHRTISNDLTRHFGESADPRTITPAKAAEFLHHLRGRKLAPATVARRLRRVKSIFAFAVKNKFVTADPFTELKAASALPDSRRHYISTQDAESLIVAANPTWRTIIALARFAGLRCPSEVLMLRWEHINFETGRMTVPSCKTEHIPGKSYRVSPIFAELRPYLDEAFELAVEGAVYVAGGMQGDGYREAAKRPGGWENTNLRTQFLMLIRRAGLQP